MALLPCALLPRDLAGLEFDELNALIEEVNERDKKAADAAKGRG